MKTLPNTDLTSPALTAAGDEPDRCTSQSLDGRRCTLERGHHRDMTTPTSGHTWEVRR